VKLDYMKFVPPQSTDMRMTIFSFNEI
jgi:hypothetical protein